MKSQNLGHPDVEQLEKQLFESLSRDEPPTQARRAAAVALGLGTATIATTAESVAAGSAAGSALLKGAPLLFVKWVGIGALAGVASAGAVRYASSRSPEVVHNAAPAPAVRVMESPKTDVESVLAPQAAPAVPPVEPAVRSEPAPEARIEPIRPRAATPMQPPCDLAGPADRVPPSAGSPIVVSSTLAAEVRMIDEAREAVAAKDGARALAALVRYARQFPNGTLNVEAMVFRIEALFLTGDTGAGAGLARQFLDAYPTSTHAARVRRLLAEHSKP